jgi:O-succinylhomoserine sulfhydrylase
MSAILVCAMTVLKAGDHVIASHSLFGSTVQLFANQMSRFGVVTTFVDLTKPEQWQAAVRPETRMLFIESPSNPLTEVADIAALAGIAHRASAVLVVDNCFCSPALQRPIELGADIIIHSATKYLDGQGRVLGGAIVADRKYIDEKVLPFMRNAGPALSAFNAWILLKGMETLHIRMEAQSSSALELARWLEQHPGIDRVYYPGLASHPQHALAMKQQRLGGAVVAFDVKGGKDGAWRVVDSTRMISITANLGDTKTTITHPATTTHGRINQAARVAAGIGDGLLRIAVGLESVRDLREDLARGLT